MKAIASAIRFVIYSNLFIAFCTTAYTAKTSFLVFGNNGNRHINLMVFSLVLFFYCFHRINKKKFLITDEDKESRNSWMSKYKITYWLLITSSAVIAFVQFFYLPLRAGLLLAPVVLLGIGYTFPVVFTGSGWKRLRDISWLKPFWIAFAFSWLTTFLPVIFAESLSFAFRPEVLFIFCRSFLFIFALCIPFDIRDMHFDELRGVQTLPVSAGVQTSIHIAISLLLLFISLVCIQFLYYNLDFKSASALFLSAIITISLLPFAKPGRPPLFFPLLYDGSMLIQWIVLVAVKHF